MHPWRNEGSVRFTGEQILTQIAQALGTTVEQLSTTLSGSSTLDAAIVGATGINRAAAINDAIADASAGWADDGVQRTVRLLTGAYSLETALVMQSGVRLVSEAATLTASFTGVGVDTPTNGLVLAQGLAANLTTLASAGVEGTDAIEVASASGISAGMYLVVTGHNAAGYPSDAGGFSDGAQIVLTEIVQVASSYVSGTTIPLTSMLKQWHASGATVQTCTPIREIALEGITLDCAGGTIADGLLLDYAHNVEINQCRFRGFSRAAVEVRLGSEQVQIRAPHFLGELNSGVYCLSAHGVNITDIWCDPHGKRFHAGALGVKRHCVKTWLRCTDIHVHGGTIQHMCGGVSTWGGSNISISDLLCRDLDVTEISNSDTLYGGTAGVVGIAIDSGEGPLGTEEFAFDISWDNIDAVDCYTTLSAGQDRAFAFHIHDVRKCSGNNLRATNMGLVSGSTVNGTTRYYNGFRMNDVHGPFGTLYATGVTYGLYTTGLPYVDIEMFYHDGQCTNGTAQVGLYFDDSTYAASPRIKHYKCTPDTGIYFGSNFTSSPDYRLRFDLLEIDDDEWPDVILADHTDGQTYTKGAVVEFTSGGTTRVQTPSGASDKNAIVAYPVTSTLCLVSPCPVRRKTSVTCSSAAVAVGEYLESNASRQGVVQATPGFTTFGRALTAKSAGSAGTVRVGPR